MTQFIVRIAIIPQENTLENNNKLYEAMISEGFTNIVWNRDGQRFYLPKDEYSKIGEYQISAVIASAQIAANHVGAKYSVLVSQLSDITFNGLEVYPFV